VGYEKAIAQAASAFLARRWRARFWNAATSSANQQEMRPSGSGLKGAGNFPDAIFEYNVEFDQPVAAKT
jgi:hypothetical protein